MTRMGMTSAHQLPSFDPESNSLIDPNMFERKWYNMYEKYGPVGDNHKKGDKASEEYKPTSKAAKDAYMAQAKKKHKPGPRKPKAKAKVIKKSKAP